MPKGPIRRAQLVAPFGTGAMTVVRDGTSLVTAGLDHWFEAENGLDEFINVDDFKLTEWRLERFLNVKELRLPPDFRKKNPGGSGMNCYMTVPFLRFPQWHFCPNCYRLEKLPLALRVKEKCPECNKQGKSLYLVQVPFVAICDMGHLQDFPWREWVHRSAAPTCNMVMRLVATGGASLSAQKVKCACGASRPLTGITRTFVEQDNTLLSRDLDASDQPFLCQGHRPWLGTEQGEPCPRPLKGSLRSASNVYYANVVSAIYLPRSSDKVPNELISLFEVPPLSTFVQLLISLSGEPSVSAIRGQHSQLIESYTDEQLSEAIKIIISGGGPAEGDAEELGADPSSLRYAEYRALRESREEDQLLVESISPSEYDDPVNGLVAGISLIKKLRETRVLAGFSRIIPDDELERDRQNKLLWRKVPEYNDTWLPAYMVFGEGIFIEFDQDRLAAWEGENPEVLNRILPLLDTRLDRRSGLALDRSILPRFVMIHTFAHLLINQLTFECGYSSAALRERLYVSDQPDTTMAGVMIYTASGDAEGSMGGLVSMGKSGRLEPVVQKALDDAKWCSADPVCMELGRSGQGPESCNLAACHSCALIPETACEEFNRFLDRGLVVGDYLRDNSIGFFQ
jgi:hypothetical protein